MAGVDQLADVMGVDNDLDPIERDNLMAAAAAEIRRCRNEVSALRLGLRLIRNHWCDFGPSNGFEETIARACQPIQINSDEESAPWDTKRLGV